MSGQVTVQVHAFRKNHSQIVKEICSDIDVFPAIETTIGPMEGRSYVGLWDTGATGTCITQRVVADLGLIPIGKAQCSHAGGQGVRNRYFVNLKLPNNVGVKDISVVEVDLDEGVDVLIGMDIISLGDFVLTHAHGTTHFSFRIPALGGVDFSVPPPLQHGAPMRRVLPSKNGPCPCGSQKKYKACCRPKFR